MKTHTSKFVISSEITKKYVHSSIDQLPEDGSMVVEIKKYIKDKTHNQRAGFHLLISILTKEGGSGYTQGEIKEIVKEHVFGTIEFQFKDKTYYRIESSETLKRDDYSKLIEGAYWFGNEIGCILPELKK